MELLGTAWNSLGTRLELAWNCLELAWNCLELLGTRLELLGTRLELAWNCLELLGTAWNSLGTRLELLETRWGLARSCLKSIFIQEPPEAPHAEPRSHPWGVSAATADGEQEPRTRGSKTTALTFQTRQHHTTTRMGIPSCPHHAEAPVASTAPSRRTSHHWTDRPGQNGVEVTTAQ